MGALAVGARAGGALAGRRASGTERDRPSTQRRDAWLCTACVTGRSSVVAVRDSGGMHDRVDDEQPGPTPAARVTAVSRELLRDAVFDRLLDHILRGEYRRGQRLRLDTIATAMQVSRTPVREALVPLEALGLVTVQQYVGVVIAPWTVHQMVERVRIARTMLLDPPACGVVVRERFDPRSLDACLTEVGRFVELSAWVLRRAGSPVSADWLGAQAPLLDAFFTDDIALVNGIDASADRGRRERTVQAAIDAALADDVSGCTAALCAVAEQITALPARFGVPLSA